MEQLIFIGILVLFSVLDAIAKKKKKEAERQAGAGTTEEGWVWEPVDDGDVGDGHLPTYDADPTYDEEVVDDDGIPGEPLPRYTQPYRSSADPPTPTTSSPDTSEGLIPKDVWAEIEALAGGRPRPQAPEPTPAPVPVPVEDRNPERRPERPDHVVHRAHRRYGTPVSERLTALDLPEDHQAPGQSQEIRSVRRMLSGDVRSLRKAVILQELLGKPVSMRSD